MSKNKTKLPEKAKARTEILSDLETFREKDSRWSKGETWSLVYHAGDEHTEFLKKAYQTYFHENGLNPFAFPSLKRFEAEVVSMAVNLLGGGDDSCGTMTSGGTESILMAVKTYRDQARATRPEITHPEMIVPISIHPAFEKAAHYFGVKAVHIPVDENFRADLGALEKAYNKNTILIVGSAPTYPQGVIDPIEKMAAFAKSKGVGFHVDACLGGFLLPFLKMNGEAIPPFDLSVDGVTSLSADLHKYGFTAKGASVVLYNSSELRRFQFFVYTGWTGGLFGSPSMPGTRPGGSIAAAWAALNAFGIDGYKEQAKGIIKTVRELQEGISAIPTMRVLGKPEAAIFAFTSNELDVYAIGDQMEVRGWLVDRQQNPACLHLMVTPAHAAASQRFLTDLKSSVSFVKEHPECSNQGSAAMYGMMAKIPDAAQVNQFILHHMDERYET